MIGATVLAAGASRRLGRSKQLLKLDGVPFVRHAAECAAEASERLAVVVGCGAETVVESLSGVQFDPLYNLFWSEGIASSIRVAVDWARRHELEALLLVLCDQPHLNVEHLQRLRARYEECGLAVASRYAGTIGAPAIFPAGHYDELSRLEGDRGAARILREGPAVEVVEFPRGEIDVDTEAEARPFR